MSEGKKKIIFRDSGEEGVIIKKTTELLGLNNDTAAIRVLLRLGYVELVKTKKKLNDVIHPLKSSEIDYFLSSLKINAKLRLKKNEGEKE